MTLGFCRVLRVGDNSGKRGNIGVEIGILVGSERGSLCGWIEDCLLGRGRKTHEFNIGPSFSVCDDVLQIGNL